jgi:hypothetical protein
MPVATPVEALNTGEQHHRKVIHQHGAGGHDNPRLRPATGPGGGHQTPVRLGRFLAASSAAAAPPLQLKIMFRNATPEHRID